MTHRASASAADSTECTENRYLRILGDPWYRALVELQDLISYETAMFWRERDVKCLHLPITTNSISSPMGVGSDSLPVAVNLFGIPTYLADSMQFMLEYGCRLAGEGVYYLMPSFRGEDADTTHLNQFMHSEAEVPGTLDGVITLADAYVRRLALAALNMPGDSIAKQAGSVNHIEVFLGRPSARVTFDEAVNLLDAEPTYFKMGDGWRTITRAGEQALLSRLESAVWLTNFDRLAVPFYQSADEATGKALNADLLLGPGELIGAGERHATGAEASKALIHHGVDQEDYSWYVRMKDAYPMRTSGFGMGVERFLMWLLRHNDIRDMQILERFNGRRTAP